MRTALIDVSVSIMIENGIIKKSDEELYRFGMNQLFLFVINVGTSLIIGVMCNMIWQSILFSAAYIPLRKYAGGYHAKTARLCYGLSTLLIVCVLAGLKYIPFSIFGMMLVLAASFGVIFIKAPAESENKPLSKEQVSLYKRKVRVILMVETGAVMVCVLFSVDLAMCMVAAIVCSAGMLIRSR